MSLFEIKNLNVYYGAHHALKDVNMNIEANTIPALIGPSGCGKSTFLRCLDRMNDLIPGVKVEGSVMFEGKDIYKDEDTLELRHRVGMVFQKANPFPMSIYDNVLYGVRLHYKLTKDEASRIVEESLKKASLWNEVKDRLKKSALGLSGGQQQRLCIARTLAVNPSVVLMDEPTSALDPISTRSIEDLMRELKKDYTIVIVTHNMAEAARISDRTAFFYIDEHKRGFLVEEGATSEVFFSPKDKRTEDYIQGRFS